MLMVLCILLIHADIMSIRQQINWIWSGYIQSITFVISPGRGSSPEHTLPTAPKKHTMSRYCKLFYLKNNIKSTGITCPI